MAGSDPPGTDLLTLFLYASVSLFEIIMSTYVTDDVGVYPFDPCQGSVIVLLGIEVVIPLQVRQYRHRGLWWPSLASQRSTVMLGRNLKYSL